MKWLGWVFAILTLILIVVFFSSYAWFVYFIPLYGGLFTYWCFRRNWDERKSATKKF
ncbi:hypothetical protein K9L67_02220 [Candidatus Woesearchaeota archaeon]|nr:hypothetical protein [Candidatus Woesearchaeota archaeon]MCF7901020.1 hypothetical protein [Candidatus Woesearchaeota archaeon]MCF8013399.1 hypothetical protein [Candidatus Woesearchaeota archaeon]